MQSLYPRKVPSPLLYVSPFSDLCVCKTTESLVQINFFDRVPECQDVPLASSSYAHKPTCKMCHCCLINASNAISLFFLSACLLYLHFGLQFTSQQCLTACSMGLPNKHGYSHFCSSRERTPTLYTTGMVINGWSPGRGVVCSCKEQTLNARLVPESIIQTLIESKYGFWCCECCAAFHCCGLWALR